MQKLSRDNAVRCAYLCYLFAIVLISTLGYTASSILYKIIVGMGAVLAIASLCVQKYTTKYLFLVVALFALFLIEIKITKKTTLMLTLLLLIAAKGIAQRKILATFLIAKLSGLFLMFVFVIFGLFKIEKHTYYKMGLSKYIQRISINGYGTTLIHLSVITCFVLYFILKRSKVGFAYYLFYVVTNYFAYRISLSTMGFLVGNVSILIFFVAEKSYKFRKLFTRLSIWYIPMFILFSFSTALLYSKSSIVDFLDRLFQGRIRYNNIFLTNHPFSVFGSGMLYDEGWFDNSYVYIWVAYGAIVFLVLLGAMQKMIAEYRKNNDWIALLLIFVYLLVGISESIYPSAVVNPSLFLLLPLLESVK